MINVNYYEMVDKLTGNSIFITFVVVIFLVFLGALFRYYFSKNKHDVEGVRIVAPSLILSLAILGTFTGVLIGLLGLDVRDSAISQGSVQSLIDGLVIAFGTSVVGLFLNLVLRTTFLLNRRTDIFGKDEEKTVDDLYNELKGLGASFDKFVGELGDKTVDKLMEAIQKVMDGFNEKINDQLGKDFEALRDAVHDLKNWQENYRVHVETQTEHMKNAETGLKEAESLIRNIYTSMSEMPNLMNQLKEVIGVMDQQTKDLTAKLEAFKEMKDKASEAFPFIEERLNKLTDQIDKSVTKVISAMELQATHMQEAIDKEKKKMEGLFEGFANELEKSSQITQQAFATQATKITEMTENITTATKQFEGLSGDIKDATEVASKETQNVIQASIDQFRVDMTKIASEGIDVMGSKLGSLSKKFADDYEPLTIKLKEVLDIAKNLHSQNQSQNTSDDRISK